MDNRYLVESAGGSDSAGGADMQVQSTQREGSSVAADMRELQECLKTLGDRYQESLESMRTMRSERRARIAALAPEVVICIEGLDAAAKQANIAQMIRKLWVEVEKKTIT